MKALGHLATALATAWLWLRARLRVQSAAPIGPPKRILVIGYAALGDLIFFLPVLEGLRRHYAQAKITFIANRYPTTEDLLPATGLVDDIWLVDFEGSEGASRKAEINKRIHEAGFDMAILTLASPAQYFQGGLRDIPCLVGHCRQIELRPGYRYLRWILITGEFARRVLLNRIVWIPPASEHAVVRNLKLLAALGAPVPSAQRPPRLPIAVAEKYASDALRAVDPARKIIGVHLGPPLSQYYKIWSPERFGRLCARMTQTWPVEIALVGNADEQASVERAGRECPVLHSWVGQTSLLEAFALIKRCALFVSNDTGLAKAAMALGVPTATIMGLSDPVEVGAIWEKEKHLEIRTGIFCSPCARLGMANERPGALHYLNCGHHDCLQKLEVDFAFAAIRRKYSAVLDRA